MTLNFSIEYYTDWGQNVEVELCFISPDGKTYHQRIRLETEDGYVWKGVCMLRARGTQMRYTYVITAQQAVGNAIQTNVLRREWDVVPRLFPVDDARTYIFIDHWRDVPDASYAYTMPIRLLPAWGKGLRRLLPSSLGRTSSAYKPLSSLKARVWHSLATSRRLAIGIQRVLCP